MTFQPHSVGVQIGFQDSGWVIDGKPVPDFKVCSGGVFPGCLPKKHGV